MDGGTFTISNGGVFGSLMGTPIINPPQSAILGMHGIFDRPVAVKGEVGFHRYCAFFYWIGCLFNNPGYFTFWFYSVIHIEGIAVFIFTRAGLHAVGMLTRAVPRRSGYIDWTVAACNLFNNYDNMHVQCTPYKWRGTRMCTTQCVRVQPNELSLKPGSKDLKYHIPIFNNAVHLHPTEREYKF